jgi:hypothetical protein
MRDDTTTATNTAAVRVSGSMCTGAAGARRWWRNLTPTQRTKGTAAVAVLLLLLFAVCLAVMVQHYQAQGRDLECQWYGQLYEWDLPNDDRFAASMATFLWGKLYSYKQGSTGATQGPRILILLDSWYSGFGLSIEPKEGYSMLFTVHKSYSTPEAYSFELTIGQNEQGNVVWSSSDDDHDGDVVNDPSVVHLGFSNGATYSIYNDTVFLLSYVFTGYELQVEERPIDLSGVVWTNCTSVKDFFQRNADLAAFDAQWRKH